MRTSRTQRDTEYKVAQMTEQLDNEKEKQIAQINIQTNRLLQAIAKNINHTQYQNLQDFKTQISESLTPVVHEGKSDKKKLEGRKIEMDIAEAIHPTLLNVIRKKKLTRYDKDFIKKNLPILLDTIKNSSLVKIPASYPFKLANAQILKKLKENLPPVFFHFLENEKRYQHLLVDLFTKKDSLERCKDPERRDKIVSEINNIHDQLNKCRQKSIEYFKELGNIDLIKQQFKIYEDHLTQLLKNTPTEYSEETKKIIQILKQTTEQLDLVSSRGNIVFSTDFSHQSDPERLKKLFYEFGQSHLEDQKNIQGNRENVLFEFTEMLSNNRIEKVIVDSQRNVAINELVKAQLEILDNLEKSIRVNKNSDFIIQALNLFNKTAQKIKNIQDFHSDPAITIPDPGDAKLNRDNAEASQTNSLKVSKLSEDVLDKLKEPFARWLSPYLLNPKEENAIISQQIFNIVMLNEICERKIRELEKHPTIEQHLLSEKVENIAKELENLELNNRAGKKAIKDFLEGKGFVHPAPEKIKQQTIDTLAEEIRGKKLTRSKSYSLSHSKSAMSSTQRRSSLLPTSINTDQQALRTGYALGQSGENVDFQKAMDEFPGNPVLKPIYEYSISLGQNKKNSNKTAEAAVLDDAREQGLKDGHGNSDANAKEAFLLKIPQKHKATAEANYTLNYEKGAAKRNEEEAKQSKSKLKRAQSSVNLPGQRPKPTTAFSDSSLGPGPGHSSSSAGPGPEHSSSPGTNMSPPSSASGSTGSINHSLHLHNPSAQSQPSSPGFADLGTVSGAVEDNGPRSPKIKAKSTKYKTLGSLPSDVKLSSNFTPSSPGKAGHKKQLTMIQEGPPESDSESSSPPSPKSKG